MYKNGRNPPKMNNKQESSSSTSTKQNSNVTTKNHNGIACPKTIPAEAIDSRLDIENLQTEADNRFAIVVRAKCDHRKEMICEHRLLTALITAFRNVMPLTEIIPYISSSTAGSIRSDNDVTLDANYHREYLEGAKKKNGEFIARVHFVSKKPFFWIRRDINLKEWLKDENITLEENNLESRYTTRIGFLTNV
jgi:hypothetical protein